MRADIQSAATSLRGLSGLVRGRARDCCFVRRGPTSAMMRRAMRHFGRPERQVLCAAIAITSSSLWVLSIARAWATYRSASARARATRRGTQIFPQNSVLIAKTHKLLARVVVCARARNAYATRATQTCIPRAFMGTLPRARCSIDIATWTRTTWRHKWSHMRCGWSSNVRALLFAILFFHLHPLLLLLLWFSSSSFSAQKYYSVFFLLVWFGLCMWTRIIVAPKSASTKLDVDSSSWFARAWCVLLVAWMLVVTVLRDKSYI